MIFFSVDIHVNEEGKFIDVFYNKKERYSQKCEYKLQYRLFMLCYYSDSSFRNLPTQTLTTKNLQIHVSLSRDNKFRYKFI